MKTSQSLARYHPDSRLLAARAVELIWGNYAGYDDAVFPQAELIPSVRANIDLAVRVIRRGAGPDAVELRERGRLGRERARQSVPLESVIQAYRCTERVLLLDLLESHQRPDALTSHYVGLVLDTFDRLSQAIVNDYRETMSALQSARQHVERDLVVGLAGGYSPTTRDLERATQTLGLDPTTEYRTLAVHDRRATVSWDGDRVAQDVRAALAPLARGPVLWGEHEGTGYAIFAPDAGAERILEVAGRVATGGSRDGVPRLAIGLGGLAATLGRAGRSCEEAREAMRIAHRRNAAVVDYSDVLDDVLIMRQPELAAAIAETRLHPLERYPYLLDTLRSLIRNDLSQSAVAREMFVHLNTVSHRLRRIHELTGLNPLRLAELQRLSLALAARDLATSPDSPPGRGN